MIRAISALVAPSTFSVAIEVRRVSSHDATPRPIPIPAMTSAASPISTRNSPIRATNRSVPGAALSRVRSVNPALGNRAFSAATVAAGSYGWLNATRTRVRYCDPGAISPAITGVCTPTITGAPHAKPSPSRSGSSAMIPPTFSRAELSVNGSPTRRPSRSVAPSASHASPGGGAPTVRPSCSRSRPTSGQLPSTAFNSTGAVNSPAVAIACNRVPVETGPSAASAACSAGVRLRCQTSSSRSPPKIARPRLASSRSIEPVNVPIAASAPTPRNRQASSRRRPLNRADRPRRASRHAIGHGSGAAVMSSRQTRCGHRPA